MVLFSQLRRKFQLIGHAMPTVRQAFMMLVGE
jgi:hypothetical protein